MDPCTTFAAAGKTLQFVLVAASLVKKSIRFIREGGDPEHQAIQDMLQRLLVSNDHLRRSIEAENQFISGPGPQRALWHANNQCLSVSSAFFELLQSAKLVNSRGSWVSMWALVKNLRVTSELKKLEKQVDDARANLSLSLLICVFHQTNSKHVTTGVETDLRSISNALDNSNESIKQSVIELTEKLSQAQISDERLRSLVRTYQTENQRSYLDLHQKIDAALNSTHKPLEELQRDFSKFSKHLDSEMALVRYLQRGLNVDELNERRDNIKDAHRLTFKWVLRCPDSSQPAQESISVWIHDKTSNIFWISGKAGSGKSTLLRYLEGRMQTLFDCYPGDHPEECTPSWLQERPSLLITYYAWNSGSPLQKSLRGLLQSLLGQFFQAFPRLVHNCISTRRWSYGSHFAGQPNEIDWVTSSWSTSDLTTSIEKFLKSSTSLCNIVFLIDGLDEFEASDEERRRMIDYFVSWSSLEHTKVCLSSRPWPIYQNLLAAFPGLKLEDLTHDDIYQYVEHTLSNDRNFYHEKEENFVQAEEILQEIVRRAKGVFLWVYLVVRSLIKLLEDGGRMRELLAEMDRIPDELDAFFVRIMRSVEPQYRKEASRLIRIVMCDLSKVPENHPWAAATTSKDLRSENLLLKDLFFLDGTVSSCFSLESSFSIPSKKKLEGHAVQLERRLNSRSMGLLEVSKGSWAQRCQLHERKIEFIHRTAKDFLKSKSAATVIEEFAADDLFNARVFRYNTLLTELLIINQQEPRLDATVDLVELFCHNLIVHEGVDGSIFALFDTFADMYKFGVLGDYERPITEMMVETPDKHLYALPFAVQLGWTHYVEWKLKRIERPLSYQKPLLDYALRPGGRFFFSPVPDIVKVLLIADAEPNDCIDSVPLIYHFLGRLLATDGKGFDQTAFLTVIRLLVQNGMNRSIDISMLYNMILNWKRIGTWECLDPKHHIYQPMASSEVCLKFLEDSMRHFSTTPSSLTSKPDKSQAQNCLDIVVLLSSFKMSSQKNFFQTERINELRARLDMDMNPLPPAKTRSASPIDSFTLEMQSSKRQRHR